MTYVITYHGRTRILKKSINGWMLLDGNHRNIRKFNDVASAMTWIDEERQGI